MESTLDNVGLIQSIESLKNCEEWILPHDCNVEILPEFLVCWPPLPILYLQTSYNSMSQFLKTVYFHTIYWFCFPGKLWLIQLLFSIYNYNFYIFKYMVGNKSLSAGTFIFSRTMPYEWILTEWISENLVILSL